MNRKRPHPSRHRRLILMICLLLLAAACLWAGPALWTRWEISRETSKWKARVKNKLDEASPHHAPQLAELSLQSKSTLLPRRIKEPLTLAADQSPYLISRGSTVEPGASLSVQAGVEIWFGPQAYLVARGPLHMNGTASQPIRLLPAITNVPWAGLFVAGGRLPDRTASLTGRGRTGSWSSRLAHVHFDTALYGIKAVHASLTLESLVTRNVRELYSALHSDSTLRLARFTFDDYLATGNINLFKFFKGTMWVEGCVIQCPQTDKKMDAFDVDSVSFGRIVGNHIVGTPLEGSDGIDIGLGCKDVLVANNLILSFADKGISVGENAKAVVTNNVVAYCGMGIGIKDNASASLIHNTFYQNKNGVVCYEKTPGQGGGHASITHCLFLHHEINAVAADALSTVTIAGSICDKENLPGPGNRLGDVRLLNPEGLDFRVSGSEALSASGRVGAQF